MRSWPGRRMKRCSCAGTGISALMALPSRLRSSCSARVKPRLGMKGNGWAGSSASGVSTGNICSRKWVSSRSRSSSVSSCGLSMAMPASRNSLHSCDQMLCWSAISASAASSTRAICWAGRQPVVAGRGDAGGDHAFEAGHADHVELVEVGGGDRQKAQPLQHRVARILRLLQHTAVEGEPGQFAVDEALRRVRRDGGRRIRLRHRLGSGCLGSWKGQRAAGLARGQLVTRALFGNRFGHGLARRSGRPIHGPLGGPALAGKASGIP